MTPVLGSTICDSVSATEALLCACTAYEVHCSQGAFVRLERRILKCGQRYFRTWAALDIIGALPAALILFLLLGADNTRGIAVVQILLFLKGISVLRLWDKLQRWKNTHRSLARQLLACLLCAVFAVHWASCLFWLVSTREPKDTLVPASSPSAPPPALPIQQQSQESSPRNGTSVASCLSDRRALLYRSSLDQQYQCAVLWAVHVVSLSGGREYAAWGSWERLLSVLSAWMSFLGAGFFLVQCFTLFQVTHDASVNEYSKDMIRSGLDFICQRFNERPKVGDPDLHPEWLPPPHAQRAVLDYLTLAGAHGIVPTLGV